LLAWRPKLPGSAEQKMEKGACANRLVTCTSGRDLLPVRSRTFCPDIRVSQP
jgi:hypothetical protein